VARTSVRVEKRRTEVRPTRNGRVSERARRQTGSSPSARGLFLLPVTSLTRKRRKPSLARRACNDVNHRTRVPAVSRCALRNPEPYTFNAQPFRRRCTKLTRNLQRREVEDAQKYYAVSPGKLEGAQNSSKVTKTLGGSFGHLRSSTSDSATTDPRRPAPPLSIRHLPHFASLRRNSVPIAPSPNANPQPHNNLRPRGEAKSIE
jgi:hypothetical protein